MFEWLLSELESVKTLEFFVVDGPADDRLRGAIERSPLALPDSYKAFVLEFGNVKLYRRPASSAYWVGVLAGPTEATLPSGHVDYLIGHFDDARAYVDPPKGEWNGGELPILEWHGGHRQKIADSFEEWLRMRCARARKSHGKREWEKIVRGPDPFSAEELAVVDARRSFRWRVVGTTADGKNVFEVTNGSDRVLPSLSLGVRSKDGRLQGGVYLRVGDVLPGQTVRIEAGCYSELRRPSEIEVFDLPDPKPWNKDEYAELREGPRPTT